MNRNATIGIVTAVVIVIVAGGAALWANHNKTTDNKMSGMNMSKQQATTTSNANKPTATDQTAANGQSVTISNFAFSPASLTVKKGTTVTWTNNDSATHNVTETDGQTGPNSGSLADGKSHSFTYETVGTFKYHCSIHPSMTATVTVTE